jgi:hypothetical protein
VISDDEGLRAILRYDEDSWRIIDARQTHSHVDQGPRVEQDVYALLGGGPYETLWVSTFHIHRRLSRQFRVGRVFLAGDAAHLNSPAGGQGLNGGIQDAHNLSWKLARALRGGRESLLDSYEGERRYTIEETLNPATDRLTKAVLTSSKSRRAIEIWLASLSLKLPWLHRKFVRSLTMLDSPYPGSRVLPFGANIAPDYVLSDGRRLYDRLFPNAVLCSIEREPVAVDVPWLESIGVRRFGRYKPGEAVLFRPDGYVAWEGRSTDRVVAEAVKNALGV